MSAAVNMSTTAILSALLMLGGLGGAVTSDSRVYWKSIGSDKTSPSSNGAGHAVKKQPHQQAASEIRRSLDLASFRILSTPRTYKISLPNIIKLYPPTATPIHLHANMPMRFGRQSDPGDDTSSTPNMPQRFGRSWGGIRRCAEGPRIREAPGPVLPQRFGRSGPYRGLLRTLVNKKLSSAGLYWPEDFDFTAGSHEVETEDLEKSLRG